MVSPLRLTVLNPLPQPVGEILQRRPEGREEDQLLVRIIAAEIPQHGFEPAQLAVARGQLHWVEQPALARQQRLHRTQDLTAVIPFGFLVLLVELDHALLPGRDGRGDRAGELALRRRQGEPFGEALAPGVVGDQLAEAPVDLLLQRAHRHTLGDRLA